MLFDVLPLTRETFIADAFIEGQMFVLKADYLQKVARLVKAERACYCGLVFVEAEVLVDKIARHYRMNEAKRSRLEVALWSSDLPVSVGDFCDRHRYEALEG